MQTWMAAIQKLCVKNENIRSASDNVWRDCSHLWRTAAWVLAWHHEPLHMCLQSKCALHRSSVDSWPLYFCSDAQALKTKSNMVLFLSPLKIKIFRYKMDFDFLKGIRIKRPSSCKISVFGLIRFGWNNRKG